MTHIKYKDINEPVEMDIYKKKKIVLCGMMIQLTRNEGGNSRFVDI